MKLGDHTSVNIDYWFLRENGIEPRVAYEIVMLAYGEGKRE